MLLKNGSAGFHDGAMLLYAESVKPLVFASPYLRPSL